MIIEKMFLEDLLSIDKLHYREIKIINDLYELTLREEKDKIDAKLDALVADVEYHFESEEKRMFEYHYPEANKHQYAHECALQQLYAARDTWKANKDVCLLKTYIETKLCPWLNGHMMSMDKMACDFLVKAGSN
ncbi:hemerythrin family protein [Candidatus Gracilibacteria bacterium]|nr:hemerythrin family protein [Candidatus Gracilibacteria bacterium]